LEFIYLDRISFVNANFALDLLELADKYGMSKLESVCGEYLLKKIMSQNALKVAKLANRSRLIDLGQTVLKFIQNKPVEFLNAILE